MTHASHPMQMQVTADGVAGSRRVFEHSAHLAPIEDPDRYLTMPQEAIGTTEAANAA